MLLKGNSFQNVIISTRIHKKLKKNNIFWLKSKRFLHLLCYLMWPRWFSSWLECLNLTRFFLSVSYANWKEKKKNNDKKLKKKKKLLPTYVSCFFEHVTPSTIPRRIIILLNQYGRPKNEAKFLNISPILLNFNQFHNCPFFLTNFFITLLSFLASKSSYIEP